MSEHEASVPNEDGWENVRKMAINIDAAKVAETLMGQDKPDAEEREETALADRLRGSLEHRRFSTDGMELRNTSDGGLRFTGYAATTETPYKVGKFEETFARGAFKRNLGEDPDVVLLINHEGLPLARTKSGTMTLTEDARGLRVDADLDRRDPDVQSLIPKLERRDLTEMSFAFRTNDDEWTERGTKRLVRSALIHKGDVSIVTHGANDATTAGIRSLVEEFEERSGRVLSGEKKARLKAIRDELDAIEKDGEPDPVEQAQESQEQELKVTVHRSLDTVKARRARLGRVA